MRTRAGVGQMIFVRCPLSVVRCSRTRISGPGGRCEGDRAGPSKTRGAVAPTTDDGRRTRRSGHLRLAEGGRRALDQLHLAERQQEGQGGLGPLVEVDAVLLEAVTAAAGL